MAKGPNLTKKPSVQYRFDDNRRSSLLRNPYFYVFFIVLITAGFLLIIFFYHQGLNTGHTKFELDKATYYNENEARKDTISIIKDRLRLLQVKYAELYKIEQGLPAEKLDSLRFLISLNDSLLITMKQLAEAKRIIQQLKNPMVTKSEIGLDLRQRNELAAARVTLSKIFFGSWRVIYLDSISPQIKKPYQTEFDLLTSGRYLEQNIHTCDLEDIHVSDDQKAVRFIKVPVDGQDKNIKVELVKQGYGLYRGTENGRRVEYKKQRE